MAATKVHDPLAAKRPTGPICRACDGHGEIVANPSPDQDPQLEERAVCYRCGGTGTPLVRR